MTANPSTPSAAAPELENAAGTRLAPIWTLAWPVIVTLSVESFVGLVDMLMVGRLGPTAVAAVGVGMSVVSAVSTTMFAVGTGTLAIVARHVGAGERTRAAQVLYQSVLAALALGVLVVVPVAVWAPAIVGACGVGPAVVATATPFIRTVLAGVPADAVFFVIALGLRGAGDTRTPLVVGVLVAAVTVAADWTLIFGHFGLPALGVRGAGSATALGMVVGAGAAVLLLARGRLALALPRARRPQPSVVRRVLAVGYPAAIEHALMQVGFLLYMKFVAVYGTTPVAAYIIGVRILALSFLPGFGFAAAAGALVGQNLGAERPAEAERSGWAATRLAAALMSAGGAVIFLAAAPVARLFTTDAAVVADAVGFIRVLALAQPLMAVDFTLGGALRGAGDTRFPLLVVLVAFYVCRLGAAGLTAFALHAGLVWVWLAVLGDYCARVGLKALRFRSGRWQRVRV